MDWLWNCEILKYEIPESQQQQTTKSHPDATRLAGIQYHMTCEILGSCPFKLAKASSNFAGAVRDSFTSTGPATKLPMDGLGWWTHRSQRSEHAWGIDVNKLCRFSHILLWLLFFCRGSVRQKVWSPTVLWHPFGRKVRISHFRENSNSTHC